MRGQQPHPQAPLPHLLLRQVDGEAVQLGARGPGPHPLIHLDMLPSLCSQYDSPHRAQTAKVGLSKSGLLVEI